MPILIDYNQYCLSAIFNSMKSGLSASDVVDENNVRHILLNHLRSNRKKFAGQFGELVICCDSKNTWRKDFFPYYKIRRNRNKKESDIDWGKLYQVMQTLKEELKQNFPYKVIEVEKCEADDIIGVICHTYGDEFLSTGEDFLILSRDKDYKQLLKFRNVKQYDPFDHKFMVVEDPEAFLDEMVICGDSGDDIPNILSEDNVFAIGKRQGVMTQKRKEAFLAGTLNEQEQQNWKRNKVLIDLYCVPNKFKKQIIEQYNIPCNNKRGKLMDYFFKKGLSNLLSDIGDF